LFGGLLLEVFSGIRSERPLIEQVDDHFLDRWFGGLAPDDPVGADALHDEPRAAAEWRGICQVHAQAFHPSAGQAAVIRCACSGDGTPVEASAA
jgi:hypothetical protein